MPFRAREDLCFAIWYPSQGHGRTTALISRVILPREDERRVHGNANFLPHYFERSVFDGAAGNGGLAFFHSHPARGWQDMSGDDIRAEQGHAASAQGATGLLLVDPWNRPRVERAILVESRSAAVRATLVSTVRVVCEALSVTYHDRLTTPPGYREELKRTISAWGPKPQADLARLRIGVVGAGSVEPSQAKRSRAPACKT